MTYKNISIATMTHDGFGDGELMREALSVLAKKRYMAIIADGGSSENFIHDITKMGHYVTYPVKGGLIKQHKDSILRASRLANNVLYTEPDKLDWFNNGLDQSVEEYIFSDLEFAAISRTPEVIRTYPIHQQNTESFANDFISRTVLNRTGEDFIYGPKLFHSGLAGVLEYPEAEPLVGWQGLMYLVAKAHKMGLKMDCLPYAAPCPLSQRKEDNEIYRIKQMTDNLTGFLIGLK